MSEICESLHSRSWFDGFEALRGAEASQGIVLTEHLLRGSESTEPTSRFTKICQGFLILLCCSFLDTLLREISVFLGLGVWCGFVRLLLATEGACASVCVCVCVFHCVCVCVFISGKFSHIVRKWT